MATDPYHWAKENEIYMSQDELANLIRTKDPSLLVIDVRNDDNGGGRVAKSVHIPDGEATFSPSHVVDIAFQGRKEQRKNIIVLHCMESARRGPRCAKRLVDYLAKIRAKYLIDGKNSNNKNESNTDSEFDEQSCLRGDCEYKDWEPRIHVLWGGADLWIRRFWNDRELVEDFDPEYWSFSGADNGINSDNNKYIDQTGSHCDYVRPDDQPQTEWSSAGSAVKK